MKSEPTEQSRELFNLIVANVRDFAVYMKDLDGHVLSWNPGVERLLGYSESEWLGQHVSIIFTPEDLARGDLKQELSTALEEGRAEDQRWHIRNDGSRFWANGLLMLLRDEEGKPRAFAKILRDDTARHQAEEDLRKAHEQLEQRVEERTRDLQEMSAVLLEEVKERRAAEGRIKELLHRIIGAQEIERKRIARDLHDNLGQQLTALRLNMEILKEECGGREDLCEKVDKTLEIAKSIDAEVDFIAWEMRPAALDHLGLGKALDNFAQEWAKHYGIPIEFSDVGLGDSRLGPEVEINLYRITQEALNNVMKHAGASRAAVLIERRDGQVVLIVEDDGKGFEPAKAVDGEKGMGLLSMRERAMQVGGALEIESEPGMGTTLYVRVPAGKADSEKQLMTD